MKLSLLNMVLGGLCTITLLVSLSGCESDNSNTGRLVCEVVSVNGGNPLMSAYVIIKQSGETYQRIDTVPISLYARPYGCTVTISCGHGPYTMFQVTRYDVMWDDVSGRPGLQEVDLPMHNVIGSRTNVSVPIHETSSASVLIVDPEMKDSDWFKKLGQYPLPTSFEANARIVFYGHETGSSREISFETGLRVLFLFSLLED